MAPPPAKTDGSEIVERFRAPDFIRKDLTEFVLNAGAQVWSRPGLEAKYRSLATIAALTALQRSDALREHIGIGLDNGLEPREICETLLQCAIYAGFPTCIHAMELAQEVFEARGLSE